MPVQSVRDELHGVLQVRVSLVLGMVVASALMCGAASADPVRVGFGSDLGVPSGYSLGVVVHPATDMLSVQPSLTYNGLGWGGRLALKFDPMARARNLPVGLFLDLQGGVAASGTVPGHRTDAPSVGYDYINTYLGLRLGKAQNFHWNFEVGPSYMHVATGNFQSVVGSNNGFAIGNPTANVWLLPTFVTGFEVVWP